MPREIVETPLNHLAIVLYEPPLRKKKASLSDFTDVHSRASLSMTADRLSRPVPNTFR